MAHEHNIVDSDIHFSVDPESRAIISQSNKKKLMRGDHNSERFTFRVPRYIEGHDMSLCNVVCIHYENRSLNKQYVSAGPYPVVDVEVSKDAGDYVVFSWLISRNATTYSGSLSFSISFECVNDDVVEYSWATDTYNSIEIIDTIRNDGSEMIGENHDVLASLIALVEENNSMFSHGLEGQFAISDGNGGIAWTTLTNVAEEGA